MLLDAYKDQVVWIVGASSGIGRALAVQLHEEGAKLALSARRRDELEQLNAELGGKHLVVPLDVVDADEMAKAAQEIVDHYGRLDRAVNLASIYKPSAVAEIDMSFMSKIVDVNLKGSLHFVAALLPHFQKQGFGQLALTASVAAYVGLPNAQPYGATKAATINLAETLKSELPKAIDIKLINPGFVETPMTNKNDFDMPMIISAEKAALEILKGLRSKNFEVHFPKRFTRFMKLTAALPYWLAFLLLRRLVK